MKLRLSQWSAHRPPIHYDYLVGVPGSMLAGIDDQVDWDDRYEDEIDEEADETIEGSIVPNASPPLPTRMAASLRRMIFGEE